MWKQDVLFITKAEPLYKEEESNIGTAAFKKRACQLLCLLGFLSAFLALECKLPEGKEFFVLVVATTPLIIPGRKLGIDKQINKY